MKATGVVTQIGKPQVFKKKDGTDGYKSSIVIDTDAKYNPTIQFDIFKDELRAKVKDIQIGACVDIEFNLYSRAGVGQYEGRFFHNITAWDIKAASIENDKALDVHFAGTTPDDLPF